MSGVLSKAYETYVGKRNFQPEGKVFDRIQEVGQEFGATTGRVRQCNWLNVKEIHQAIQMNGVNRLVVNKMDVLREIDAWGTTDRRIHGERQFRTFLQEQFGPLEGVDKVYFSDNPATINEENPLTAAA